MSKKNGIEVYYDSTVKKECEDHIIGPLGYVHWHNWAAEMSKTHTCTKCPGCGFYKIWTLKTAEGK